METTPFSTEAAPPPPLTPPPPVITPPPAPKPRRSWGWMIAAIIFLVLLIFSLFGNLAQFAGRALSFDHGFKSVGARDVGPRLDECLLQNNDSHNKIAVIRINGIITSHQADQAGNNMVDVIKAQLNRAANDNRVKAVILKVDSPGGEVLASDQIYHAIRDFESGDLGDQQHPGRHGKPVICSMGSLAASGGYYISSACRWIVANKLTLTGSIGVIMEGLNYRGLMDKVGIRPVVYKSGKFKDMLSGMRETNQIPPEEHAMVQALINQTYEQFKSVVTAGRGNAYSLNKPDGHPLSEDWTNYADGRVLSGTQALKLGFVDELGDFHDAVNRAEEIAHIKNANLIEYRERYDFSDFLSMFSQSSRAPDIKLDLGIDMPKLQAGERYYLWLPPSD